MNSSNHPNDEEIESSSFAFYHGMNIINREIKLKNIHNHGCLSIEDSFRSSRTYITMGVYGCLSIEDSLKLYLNFFPSTTQLSSQWNCLHLVAFINRSPNPLHV